MRPSTRSGVALAERTLPSLADEQPQSLHPEARTPPAPCARRAPGARRSSARRQTRTGHRELEHAASDASYRRTRRRATASRPRRHAASTSRSPGETSGSPMAEVPTSPSRIESRRVAMHRSIVESEKARGRVGKLPSDRHGGGHTFARAGLTSVRPSGPAGRLRIVRLSVTRGRARAGGRSGGLASGAPTAKGGVPPGPSGSSGLSASRGGCRRLVIGVTTTARRSRISRV